MQVALSVTLILTFASQVSATQVWVGPSDIDGRMYRPPLTDDEIQEMASMRAKYIEMKEQTPLTKMFPDIKFSPEAAYQPTDNMFDYDVLHYKLDVIANFYQMIEGSVDMTFTSLIDGLTSVDVNMTPDMWVTGVRLNGIPLSWSHSGDVISSTLDAPMNTGDVATLTIEYEGWPSYFYLFYGGGMFCYDYDNHDICFTFAEPWGARGWWPCKDFPFDKPDSVDILLTYPTVYNGHELVCASNGLLVSETDNGDGTTTSHWFEKHPIATYLVATSISGFDKITQQWEYAPGKFMPVEHYHVPTVGPDDPSGSTYYMVNFTIPSLEALTYFWGIYPFCDEKYGHMHDLAGGAMEHQTCTSIHPQFSTEWVIPHELAHHWAGDQVTCKDFHHMWLNEGFASYSEVLYVEYHYGLANAKSYLNSQRHLNAGSPYVENFLYDNVFDGNTVYDKGSWLVHMLRHQMGDSLFFPAMQYYFHESEFAGGSATSEDLCAVMSDFYGSDMSWFFDAWVYNDGQPNYAYSYMYEPDTISGEGYLVDFFLEQNNDDGVFPMYVEVVAYAGAFDTLYRLWNGSEGDLYSMHLPNPPDSFKIDPFDKILKRAEEVPFTMHIATSCIPDAIYGKPYSFQLQAIGGVPDYTWDKTLGQLPYGLTLNENTGEIYGTPGWIADYYFKVKCTDSDSPPTVDERGYAFRVVETTIQAGDCNGSGEVDLDDIMYLLNYIFLHGDPPVTMEAGDADCSGCIDIDDVVCIINYVFRGGPPPGSVCGQ